MFKRAGVSKSGYYDWKKKPTSATNERREYLKGKIKKIFDDSHGTYGYRRVHAGLERQGEAAGPELVRALMRDMQLVACQPRPWRLTTIPDPDAAATPDLVRRDFTAAAPGTKMIGDITYIKTWEGWLYLATVIDCYTKMVFGYAMGDHMKASLVSRLSSPKRSTWQFEIIAYRAARYSTQIMPRSSLSRGVLTSPAWLEVRKNSAA